MASKPLQPENDISPLPLGQDLAIDDPQPASFPPADTTSAEKVAQANAAPVNIDNDATVAATQAVAAAPTSAPPAGATGLGRSVRGGNMEMRVLSRALQDLDVLTGGTRAATYALFCLRGS